MSESGTDSLPSKIAPQRLALDGCAKPSRTALRLTAGITFDSWQRVGRQLSLIHDSTDWWLGDWLVYGQTQYGMRYREAVERTHLDYQTLRNYAWVARKFDLSRRRDTLSFHHHAEVAALQPAEQDMWLDRAHVHGWSKTRLRGELRAARTLGTGFDTGVVDTVKLNLEPTRLETWAKAAAVDEADLTSWILDVVDDAAARRLQASQPDPRGADV